MSELETIIDFVAEHGSALVVFIFAVLLFLDKFFGTVSNLTERFGIETRASLEKKHQAEVIEQQKQIIAQHAETLNKLTEILNNQNKEIREIKEMLEKQAKLLDEQNVNLEKAFKDTAALANKIAELMEKINDACAMDVVLGDGVAAILRDRLKQAHRYYVEEKGYISTDGLKNIEAIYHVYSDKDKLHQNGVGTKLYEEIKALPVKDRESF